MPDKPDEGLRERKKRATRKAISDVATTLFLTRGFDAVSVAEIAEAANVSKMTVFNYYPRKEDLFFDRQDEGIALARASVAARGRKRSPLAALRDLAHDLAAKKHPFASFDPRVVTFWRTVSESAALSARARELREDTERAVARILAEALEAPSHDPAARLLAVLAVAGWAEAYREGLHTAQGGKGDKAAQRVFLKRIDAAFAMAQHAAKGTPYA